ncbi:LuxR C-terminal-related transcriptional regulator [Cellvibrio mixtus]|uniref:LuxR C-terminal-related transcriptional regulator n=1 Tax=Cellvibrio mixtus TaxID=39650 RepID=UPI000587CDBB|nr:LuxR C-terminal-related transcriptional regulator [Cellvibrio mixtus]
MNGPTERTETGYQCGDLHTSGLPPRQCQVLLLRARGNSISECAQLLCCSPANIKQAITALFLKLHADSTPELITKAIRNGYLQLRSIFFVSFMCFLSALQADDNGINARVSRTTRTQTARAQRAGKNKSLLIDIEEIC